MCRGQGSGPRVSGLGGRRASACGRNVWFWWAQGCSLLWPTSKLGEPVLPTFLEERVRESGWAGDRQPPYGTGCLALCSLGCIPLPWFWCGQKRKDNLCIFFWGGDTEPPPLIHRLNLESFLSSPVLGTCLFREGLGAMHPRCAQSYLFIADQLLDKLSFFFSKTSFSICSLEF